MTLTVSRVSNVFFAENHSINIMNHSSNIITAMQWCTNTVSRGGALALNMHAPFGHSVSERNHRSVWISSWFTTTWERLNVVKLDAARQRTVITLLAVAHCARPSVSCTISTVCDVTVELFPLHHTLLLVFNKIVWKRLPQTILHQHLPPQSPRSQEAAHLLSQLVGNYDADTLCDACLRLAETIEQGLLSHLRKYLSRLVEMVLALYVSPEGRDGLEVLPSPFLAWFPWCG